jgi:hypothetical protein
MSAMHAQVGDSLIVGGDPGLVGLIIGVPHADGTPPYVVRWRASGYIAMVSPGHFSRVVRAASATTGGRPADSRVPDGQSQCAPPGTGD